LVYLAFDTNEERMVCIKAFRGLDDEFEKSYKKEVAANFALRKDKGHPNILKIVGIGKSNFSKGGVKTRKEVLWIATEVCNNQELFDYACEAGGLSEPILRQLYT